MDLLDIQKKLQDGFLFLHPTDTLPGIGCLLENQKSIHQLSDLKKVKSNRDGFISLVGSFEQAIAEYSRLHDNSLKLLQRFWPGPLTFVHASKRHGSIALRFPLIEGENMRWFQKILAWLPSPLISTSVNISGSEHASNWKDAIKFAEAQMTQRIIIPNHLEEDAHKTRYPSTIIKGSSDGHLSVLRPGDPDVYQSILQFNSDILTLT